MDSLLFSLFVAACLLGIIVIGLMVDYIRKTGSFDKHNQRANQKKYTNDLFAEISATFTSFESAPKQIETYKCAPTEQALETSRKIEELMKMFRDTVSKKCLGSFRLVAIFLP